MKQKIEKVDEKLIKKELALKTTKEIIIKFIEVGQVNPSNFEQVCEIIYRKIEHLLQD